MSRLNPVRLVAIYGHTHQEDYLSNISHMLGLLRRRGIAIAIEQVFAGYLRRSGITIPENEIVSDPPAEAGAAISIGGDGTFLRTARWVGALQTPVLGINTGHLGFLASYNPSEAATLVDMLYEGDAVVEERLALKVDVGDACTAPGLPYALNEVAILKEDTSSMINVNVSLSGHYLADFLADGLLISTPTGSTGYSLSAGGPILFPDIDVICITPIAAHTLTARPIVAAGSSEIVARTTSRAERYRVSLDGVSFSMPVGSTLTIRRADISPRVIRRLDDSFAATLRHKLLWGIR